MTAAVAVAEVKTHVILCVRKIVCLNAVQWCNRMKFSDWSSLRSWLNESAGFLFFYVLIPICCLPSFGLFRSMSMQYSYILVKQNKFSFISIPYVTNEYGLNGNRLKWLLLHHHHHHNHHQCILHASKSISGHIFYKLIYDPGIL